MTNVTSPLSSTSNLASPVRVLVVGSLVPPDVADCLRTILKERFDSTATALQAGGAEVRFVEASDPDLDAAYALDGMGRLLVLGGADADPACYGQTPNADTIYGINAKADAYELALLRAARQEGMPVLGICRGMQLINILQGGDLVQEIGLDTMHNGTADNSIMVSHPLKADAGTRLAEIYGTREFSVRSAHHQGVGKLGDDLIVSARATDGIIEAIETTHQHWMLGVQWHPEDPLASKTDLGLLINAFLDAVRVRQAH